MMFVVHKDSLKKADITAKMDELNLYLEQADGQFRKDRHRKQVNRHSTPTLSAVGICSCRL